MTKIYTLLLAFVIGLQANAQFTEGFENGIPSDWSVINQGDPKTWSTTISTADNPSHTGDAHASIRYSSDAHDDYLVTPAVTVTLGTADRLKFYAYNYDEDYQEYFDVKISTTGTNPSDFTIDLATDITPQNYQWTEYQYDLSVYAGQTIYIAFYSNTTDLNRLYLDDVTIDTLPSCFKPTGLTVTGVSSSTANVSWTAPSNAPSNGYEYYYSTTNNAPTPSTLASGTVNSPNVALTGLSSGTEYYVWSRSICNNSDKSEWSYSVSFNTSCTSTTVPYVLNFDDASEASVLNCLTIENNGSGHIWGLGIASGTGAASFISGKAMKYTYDTSYSADTWFYTQGLALEVGKTYELKFKYAVSSNAYPEKLKVAYGSFPNSSSMVNELADYTTNSTAGEEPTLVFTPSQSGIYYIGFQCHSDADMATLFVDDIRVTEHTLATNEVNINDLKGVKLYPNPFQDVVNISDIKGVEKISIVDMVGRIVKSFSPVKELNVSELNSGMYLINLSYEDGSVKTLKAIKE